MSVEGGIRGQQQRLVCPNCGQTFFAWRPDELPAQKIKCYFCRHEFADEAAMRPAPAPIPTPAPAPPANAEPAAPETATGTEAAPAASGAVAPAEEPTP